MPRSKAPGLALILAFAAMVAACGAGVVGTGTGSAAVPVAEAALCSADFGAALACVTTGGNGAPPSEGTAAVIWADANPQGQGVGTLAEVTGDQIVLQVPCTGLRFEGRWSLMSDDTFAFAGTYVTQSMAEPQAGVLRVTPDDTDPLRLHVQLFDSAFESQGGPWEMVRTSARPAFAACQAASSRRP